MPTTDRPAAPRCMDCVHDHYRTGQLRSSCRRPLNSIRFQSWLLRHFIGRRQPQDPPCPGFWRREEASP